MRGNTGNAAAVSQHAPSGYSANSIDDDTGLVYYGRRFYSPSQGRFLGRDTIEEQGGLNLYRFCGNNAINRWDVLGMIPAIPAAVWDALNLEFTASGTRWAGEASSGFSVEDPSGGGYWTLESDWNEGTAMAHRVAYFEKNRRGGFDRNVALTMSGDGDIFGGGLEDGAYNANMFGFTADTALFLADWGLGPGHLFGSGGLFAPISAGSTHTVTVQSLTGDTSTLPPTVVVFNGRATLYNARPGALTASGQPFDPDAMAAAMPPDLASISMGGNRPNGVA